MLIALLWPAHEHFEAAHEWFASRRGRWATCPLTQLAFVRIVSNPAFSRDALTPADGLALLQRNLAHPDHEFWADDVSLLEAAGPWTDRLQGYRQLSDIYLLGLALRRNGALATFDAGLKALAGRDRGAALEVVAADERPRPRRS